MVSARIFTESEIAKNPGRLKRLWLRETTLLLVPDRSGVERHWLEHSADQLPLEYKSGCFGILTSGSAGEPKLVIGNKNRSESLVRALHKLQDSESVIETVCSLPLSYSYAFINQWLWTHIFNRRIRLTSGFSEPETLQSTLLEAQDAMLCLVGSQVPLIRRFFPEAVFPGVIRLHFAGGPFPQEQLKFLGKRFPNAKIFNNYGCTEAMPRLTLRAAEDADDASHIGHTLPGVEMKSGPDKKLLFRSPFQAVGYVDDSGFNAMALEDWTPTGDLGEQLEDGSWRLLGRASEVFKRFGEKISLPKVLTMVKNFWSGDAAFYRQIDPAGEQAYVLVLSPEPDKEQLRKVLMGFRKNHTRPHWPLRIESMDRLPILANGKTDTLGLETAPDKILHWKQRI